MYGLNKAEEIASRLWSVGPEAVEYLPGGMTNANFKVTVKDGARYVVRVFGQESELLPLDRKAEVANTAGSASLGIGPAVIADLESEGAVVLEFIDGKPVTSEEVRTPEMLPRVVGVLRALHSGPSFANIGTSPFLIANGMFDVAMQHGGVGDAQAATYNWAQSIANRIESVIGYQATAPCHCDLLAGNIIDDGTIRLVDWEFSSMQDPRSDLGSLSMHHGFTLDDDRDSALCYCGTAEENLVAGIRLMRFMALHLEALFALIQGKLSDIDFDFMSYYNKCVERMHRMEEEPEFSDWFKILQSRG